MILKFFLKKKYLIRDFLLLKIKTRILFIYFINFKSWYILIYLIIF